MARLYDGVCFLLDAAFVIMLPPQTSFGPARGLAIKKYGSTSCLRSYTTTCSNHKAGLVLR